MRQPAPGVRRLDAAMPPRSLLRGLGSIQGSFANASAEASFGEKRREQAPALQGYVARQNRKRWVRYRQAWAANQTSRA